MTEAVTQLTSSHDANKLAARSTADAESSDNSDSGKVMKRMIDRIWSLSMKWIIVLTMKST